ncbi:MAG: alpha/beta hydrolase [Geodermatophilaceae bacterium]|nr:alpha/beta hydrolase [Geodermatophilaceae bacterium]
MSFVFVHGLIGSFADPATLCWLEPAAAIAPDLHGYGFSAEDDTEGLTIEGQVDYLHSAISRQIATASPIHLVGHSVGAVIAATYAYQYPDRVASFVNVEGNFTLNDAFWSRQLAGKSADEVHQIVARDQSDPARWLRDAGVEPSEHRVLAAAAALAYQPASTVRATARAVVEFTGQPRYDSLLRSVFAQLPVHLVAGARSRSGWDVPDWALQEAASYTEVPNTGHMIMLEAPEVLGQQLHQLFGSPRS